MISIFRWVQATESRCLQFLASMRLYLFLYILYQLGIASIVVYTYIKYVWTAKQVKAAVRYTDFRIYKLIRDEPVVIGFNVSFLNVNCVIKALISLTFLTD